jgi:type I restriction enzyme S subunit
MALQPIVAKESGTGTRPLPKGWTWAKLGDVCSTTSGGTPSRGVSGFYGGTIPWIKSGELNDGIIEASEELITERALSESSAKLFPKGTLLIALYGATVGKLAVLGIAAATNQAVCGISVGDVVDRDYLFYYLLSRRDDLVSVSFGGAQPNISQSVIRDLTLPLPPLAEQRRITADLKERLAHVERTRASAETQLATAGCLFDSYLRQEFHGIVPLAVSAPDGEPPSGWRWALLTSVARLESGHTPSRYHPEWWGGDVPWLALPDIRALDGLVAYETSEYTNPEGIANSSARILPTGTVCLSRTASVGFVAIMGRPMATSQDFVNWVCGPGIDSTFLAWLLRAARHLLHSLSSGAIHKTIYVPTVKAFRVCLPAIDQQREIGQRLTERFRQVGFLRSRLDETKDMVEALPSALLRHAFTGEL